MKDTNITFAGTVYREFVNIYLVPLASLGFSWVSLGVPLASFGMTLGLAAFGCPWPPFGHLGRPVGPLLGALGDFGLPVTPFWGPLGVPLPIRWPSLASLLGCWAASGRFLNCIDLWTRLLRK